MMPPDPRFPRNLTPGHFHRGFAALTSRETRAFYEEGFGNASFPVVTLRAVALETID